NRSIVEFSAIASRVVNLVDPNSVIDLAELASANSGDYLYGSANDVTALALNKSQDFGVMRVVAESIEERVSRAFMIQNFRQAERVTAEEIRAQSEELESVLGGTFSVLASELQEPVASRYLYIAERRNLIPPIPSGIKPKVITGLAALGRAAEVNRLRAFISDASTMLQNPAVTQHFNVSSLLTRLGVEHGVLGLTDLLKSDEQKAEEQQQAMMQQAAMSAAPQIMDAAMQSATQGDE
ncbi:portal protein, partial [Brevundimonas sp.]